MVKSCAAYKCTNSFQKCKPLNFHRFPLKNEDLCKQWFIATRRQNFTPNESSYICGDQFNKTAIPSIFHFPTHLNKNLNERNHSTVSYLRPNAKPSWNQHHAVHELANKRKKS